MKTLTQLISRLSLLLLIFILAACDGGIFGTGDGGPIVPIDASSPPETGGDPDENMPPTSAPISPGTSLDNSPVSFENLDISTDQENALINVLNYSESTLAVRIDDANADRQVIAANSNGPALSLAPDTSSLSLVDSAGLVVFEFAPFTVAAQSLSTIIVREDENGITAIAVRSESGTNDAANSRVRIIQVGQLGDASSSTAFTLQPGGDNPGPAEVVLTGISFNAQSVTDYVTVGSGDYVLSDALQRIPAVAISLDGGGVYSILLTDSVDARVVLVRDSDLAN